MEKLDWWIETSRKWLCRAHAPMTDMTFDDLLCYEIYENKVPFRALAEKWNISLSVLGELIADHCRRLERGE